MSKPPYEIVLVGTDPVSPADPGRFAHLAANRPLIVRRALLSTAMASLVPLPVMDEYVSGRVRAGLLMKLAESRQVDLPASAADVLADPRGASGLRQATLTAATLVALKLAWRKFFALLAMGRGAEEMTATFQTATLFDHYCARLHVGAAIDRQTAALLRALIHASVAEAEKFALVGVFREGSRTLARSALEAPRFISSRLAELAQRWVATRGNPATFDPAADLGTEEERWLGRAARVVDERLSRVGLGYLASLVDAFEARWRDRSPGATPT